MQRYFTPDASFARVVTNDNEQTRAPMRDPEDDARWSLPAHNAAKRRSEPSGIFSPLSRPAREKGFGELEEKLVA